MAGCGKTNGSITVNPAMMGNQYSLNGGPAQPSPTFGNLSPGNYTVTAKTPQGCLSTQLVTVTADAPPVISDVKVTQPGYTVTVGSIEVVANGRTALQYRLNNGNAQMAAQFTNLGPGSYTVVVTDADGCEANQAVTITPSTAMTILTAGAKPTWCGDANGAASMVVSGGAPPIRYSADGQTFQSAGTFDQLQAGTYPLTARDGAGCLVSQPVSVSASNKPTIADVRVTPEVCDQTAGVIIVTAGAGQTPVRFALNGGIAQAGNSFSALKAGDYALTMTDASGCVATRQVTVLLDCANSFFMPTAFSPNADQLNDVLTVHFKFPALTVSQFSIYDRWGAVLFDRADFSARSGEAIWDGMLNGVQAPVGPYQIRPIYQFNNGTTSLMRSVMVMHE